MNHNYLKRIAVVIPKYGLIGGAEGFVYNLTECLAQRDDFDVHVIANQWRSENDLITFHKVPIIRFPRWLQPVSFAYFAQKAIQAGSYDIVHSHDRIFEMDLFTFHGIPHRTWIKETKRDRLSLFDRAMVWVEQKALSNPNGPIILPVSNLVKEELLKLYDVPEVKIRVIHPGVSVDRFATLNREECRYDIRRIHGLAPDDVVILFVSMNFELKRLDLVIKGLAGMIAKQNRDTSFKLLVIGKGDSQRYQGLARNLGISGRVIFAGETREVEKYYLAGDIFAMPSRLDTFGLVVLEAMAAGLPVIISSRMGAKDVVKDGVNGYVLSANPSSEDVAEALGLLMQREKRMEMGEKGRQIASKHDWQKVANQVTELYQMISSEPK